MVVWPGCEKSDIYGLETDQKDAVVLLGKQVVSLVSSYSSNQIFFHFIYLFGLLSAFQIWLYSYLDYFPIPIPKRTYVVFLI